LRVELLAERWHQPATVADDSAELFVGARGLVVGIAEVGQRRTRGTLWTAAAAILAVTASTAHAEQRFGCAICAALLNLGLILRRRARGIGLLRLTVVCGLPLACGFGTPRTSCAPQRAQAYGSGAYADAFVQESKARESVRRHEVCHVCHVFYPGELRGA